MECPRICARNLAPEWVGGRVVRRIFEIETLSGDAGDARLKEMSDQFWAENAYGENDPDRVVLCVSLKANAMTKPSGIKPMRWMPGN